MHTPKHYKHLAQAIRIPTVSFDTTQEIAYTYFEEFLVFLEKTYPLVWKTCTIKKINTYSLIITWNGKDTTIAPYVFLAHYDVVPAEEESRDKRKIAPFSGEIYDKAIRGRGAIDNKASLISLLEAMESHIEEGFQPGRTVYLCSGHDEERGGHDGMCQIVSFFDAENIKPAAVFDEGTSVVMNVLSRCKRPLAAIGIEEKGNVTVKITTQGTAGHAAMPHKKTAVRVLAGVIQKIHTHPFPAKLSPSIKHTLRKLAKYAPKVMRPILQRPNFFRATILESLIRKPTTNALIRTTEAITVIHASDKPNVISPNAYCYVDVRIMPGETKETVMARYKKMFRKLPVIVEVSEKHYHNDPVEPASTKTDAYTLLETTIQKMFPTAIIGPFPVIARTDSRHFSSLCPNIYRFVPFILTPTDIQSIHGINEHIRVEDFNRCIEFYKEMMRGV